MLEKNGYILHKRSTFTSEYYFDGNIHILS